MKGVEFFSTILIWRKFIGACVLGVTVVVLAASFVLPKWYKATTSILPPKQQDILGSGSAASSVLKSLPGVAKLGGFNQRSSSYNYLAVLKSRTAMEAVVKKFDLTHIYDVEDNSVEKAIKELEGNVTFEETNEDYISVEVIDKDPQRAADIANFFVDQLNEISIKLGTQEARSNREFIEGRLVDSRRELRRCEDSLRNFQEMSGMVVTPEQVAGVEAIASLYGLKTKKEVELAIVRRNASKDNLAVQQLTAELSELTKKLSTIPQTGLRLLRLYRDVVIQQKIVEFLVPIYEQARIDEQKDVPVIVVLDKAVAPEKKFKPKRIVLVLTAFVLSLALSIVLVFSMTYFRNFMNERPSDFHRLELLLNDLRNDLMFWRRKGKPS